MASRGLSRDATSVVLSEDVVTQARPGRAPRVGLVLASYTDERDPEAMSDDSDEDEDSALGEGCVHVEWLSSDEEGEGEAGRRSFRPAAGLPVGRAARRRASDAVEHDEVVDTAETPLTVADRGTHLFIRLLLCSCNSPLTPHVPQR